MKIESIFQKINKEEYEIKNHKQKLKNILLNDKYFIEKNTNWTIKMIASSLSFASFIIIGTNITPIQSITNKDNNKNNTMYDRLIKNINTKNYNSYEANILEINQENIKTILYFNNKKILIGSEIKK